MLNFQIPQELGIFLRIYSLDFNHQIPVCVCLLTEKNVVVAARHVVPVPQARILSLSNSSYSYPALKQFDERNLNLTLTFEMNFAWDSTGFVWK